MRGPRLTTSTILALAVLACCAGSPWLSTPSSARTPVSAQLIDGYLRGQGSPMAGEGAHYLKWGERWNIDPRVLVAISGAESSFGKNLCGPYNAWGWMYPTGDTCWQGFRPGPDPDTARYEGYVVNMETGWEDGIYWLSRQIRVYLDRGLTSIYAIRPVYCTSGCENWLPTVERVLLQLGGNPHDLTWPLTVLPTVERIVLATEAVTRCNITITGCWHTDGSMLWTYVNGSQRDCWMEWKSGLGPGTYEVLVFIPRNHATTRNAVYHLLSGGREIASRSVNQYDIYDKWVSLGSYHFDAEPSVLLGDDTGESCSTMRQIGFDAVKFVGTPDTVPGPQPAERTIQESQAVRGGTPKYWHEVSGYGSDGRMVWTYVNGSARDNWMEWKSGLPAGTYAIQVFIPRNYATTRNAVYHIRDAGSEIATKSVNQYAYYDAWVELGVYEFRGEPSVLLGDDTGESYSTKQKVGFDAVRFVPTDRPTRGGGTRATPDVDGDGTVSVLDAQIALRIAVGLLQPTQQQLAAGDLNGDGRITTADVVRILRAAVGAEKL